MPNPFRRAGSAFHSAEWKAWSVGLLAQLAIELEDAAPWTFALIGDVGSGKTTALDAYRERIAGGRTKDVFLRFDLGKMDVKEALELHRCVYGALIGEVGETLHDEVAKKLKLSSRSLGPHLDPAGIFALIQGMARSSEEAGARVHLLVDECQHPTEQLETAGNTAGLRLWFEQLKNLAEVMVGGGGCMVITTTTSPWERGPAHARARFVELRAASPLAEEIQAFVDEGLKYVGGDRPGQARAGLGAAIRDANAELITIRQLHNLCYTMWQKASKAGALELLSEHLP